MSYCTLRPRKWLPIDAEVPTLNSCELDFLPKIFGLRRPVQIAVSSERYHVTINTNVRVKTEGAIENYSAEGRENWKG
jgi:hypothetical protein